MDDEPASLHIGQQDFEVEEETGYVTEPKEFLTGFRLSDIPADIIIKPVDRIEGHTIHITNDVAFSLRPRPFGLETLLADRSVLIHPVV